MTDPYNTSLENDKSIKDALSAQLADIKKNKKKSQTTSAESFAEMYERGINHFRSRYILVESSFNGLHCGHEIWVKDAPIAVAGINYPSWFLPYRPLFSNDDFKKLESAYSSLDASAKEFWEPLVWPRSGDSQLAQYSTRLNLMHRAESQYVLMNSFKYGHTHDPSENGIFGRRAESPRVWVPAIEWFDEKLRELQWDDIFCLFPKAEREIFKLWLGRVAVGRSNHIPENSDEAIIHTARMAVIILSREAGIGKSTITNYLYGALNKCGFCVESFKDTRDRFGMGRAAMAHILQKDDVSEESLLRFLQAEETKILISNGSLRVEEKFQAAETIFPRSSILLNSNSWSSNYAYKLDPGIQSRIKCLSTFSKAELLKSLQRLEGTPLEGCRDLRPFSMFPYLAEKYGVSIDAIFLLASRYAADYFYKTITTKDDPSINYLEEEVYKHTSRLRYRFKNDILGSFVQSLALSKAIVSLAREEEPFLPEFNFRMLYQLCKDFYFMSVDPSTVEYCTLLRKDWEEKGSITSHPYQALRDIRLDTLKQAISWAQDNYIDYINGNRTVVQSESEILKKFVSFITMRDGFKLSGSVVFFIDAINSISYAQEEIFELGKRLLKQFKEYNEDYKLFMRYANSTGVSTNDDWMNNNNYSPKIAEKLRRRKLAK